LLFRFGEICFGFLELELLFRCIELSHHVAVFDQVSGIAQGRED